MSRSLLAFTVFALVLLLSCPTIPAHAATWQVPYQCPTIQAGIDSASAGDTVVVASGTYYEHDILMKSGICLRGQTGNPDLTIIDAQEMGRVFVCLNVDDEAAIEGFTITGGIAQGEDPDNRGGGLYGSESFLAVTRCTFSNCWAEFSGGGMFFHNSSAPTLAEVSFVDNSAQRWGGGLVCSGYTSGTLSSVTFSNNFAGSGGGMFCYLESSPTLTDCVFTGNETSSCTVGGVGGGLHTSEHCSPSLMNCTFTGNTACLGAGAHCSVGGTAHFSGCSFTLNVSGAGGGGFYSQYSGAILEDCTFSENTVSYAGSALQIGGGAFYCYSDPAPVFSSCRFFSNYGSDGAAGYCWESSPTLLQSSFWNNTAIHSGALFCGGAASTPTLVGCTLTQDIGAEIVCAEGSSPMLDRTIIAFALSGGSVVCSGGADPDLTCCNIYGNVGGDWRLCIADHYGIDGNISADPLFCDPTAGNLYLDCQSPCAPAQQPECGLIGAWGVGCGATRTETTSWSALKALYR